MIYHVSKSGSDHAPGTEQQPFRTIQRAADIAAAGDTVVVHEGVYREWVKPKNGGLSRDLPVTYMAAAGDTVVIKGSERAEHWQRVEGDVWKTTIDRRIFGDYDPFRTEIDGDWLVAPREHKVHTAAVYLNGRALFEAPSLDKVFHPERWEKSVYETWGWREEKLIDPAASLLRWYAETGEEETVLYANFQGADPNAALVEFNVRKACFFPERTGINYITVRGFEMAQAATPWAPPTAKQWGIVGPNWSKGWVIEDNIIHDSKCSGISLGKEETTGDNDFTKWGRKPGYQYQLEAVFKAFAAGWSKEKIGSHIVRGNKIYDCGQNGVVGHMGSAFCEIYGNEIFRIGTRHEFYGHELGGIKLHAAVDTYVHDNYLHECTLGMWFDWQAQGLRVSANIFEGNDRDMFVEPRRQQHLRFGIFLRQRLAGRRLCQQPRVRAVQPLSRAQPRHALSSPAFHPARGHRARVRRRRPLAAKHLRRRRGGGEVLRHVGIQRLAFLAGRVHCQGALARLWRSGAVRTGQTARLYPRQRLPERRKAV